MSKMSSTNSTIRKFNQNQWIKNLDGCVTIFQLMGLQFFSLNKVDTKFLDEKVSLKWKIYLIVVLSSLPMLAGIIILVDDYDIGFDEVSINNVVMLFVKKAMNYSFIIVIVLSVLQSFVAVKKWKLFYFNLSKILQMMQNEIGFNEDFSRFKKLSTKKIVIYLSFFTICHLISSVFQLTNMKHFLLISFLAYFPINFLNIIALRMIFYVSLTNHLLKNLEKSFSKIFKTQGKISLIEQNIEKCSNRSTKLLTIRKLYNMIHENANILDNAWGLTLIVYLSGYIIALTVCEYEFLIIVVDGLDSSKLASKTLNF